MALQFRDFFHQATSTFTYVVFDPASRDALLLDPVLDFELKDRSTTADHFNEVAAFIRANGLKLHFILETHAHADHLSGAQIAKSEFPQAVLAVNEKIRDVQKIFAQQFGLKDFKADGSQFDRLLNANEKFRAGTIEVEVRATPGHTPACTSYVVADGPRPVLIFVGDAIFMPDCGTGRCDFPGGSAAELYDSIVGQIYSLPDSTRVFVGHDYPPEGRSRQCETTVGAEKKANIHLRAETLKAEYIRFREARDAKLSPPKLLSPSLQVNILAGRVPRQWV